RSTRSTSFDVARPSWSFAAAPAAPLASLAATSAYPRPKPRRRSGSGMRARRPPGQAEHARAPRHDRRSHRISVNTHRRLAMLAVAGMIVRQPRALSRSAAPAGRLGADDDAVASGPEASPAPPAAL